MAAAFVIYAASVTATPICLVALREDISFSLVGGGVLETVRSALVVVTLLFSGFIAARWGKAAALGWSCLLLAAALGVYALAPTYAVLLLALGLLGVGGGVVEALLNPMVEELHREDAGRYLNFFNAFWSVGVLLTVLVTGELLTGEVSWRIIIGTLAVLGLLPGLLFLRLRRTVTERRLPAGEVWREKRALLRSGGFWMFTAMMFFAGAAEGALTFWSASYIQIHHGGLPRAAALGVATFAAGMIVGRLASGWWLRQHLLRAGILAGAVAGIGISGALPLVQSLAAVWAVLFLAGLAVACFWPSIQAYAVEVLPFKATPVFILLSCGGIAGFGFASWLIGLLAERFGFTVGLYSIPTFFAALVVLLIIGPRPGPRGGR